MSAAKAHKRSAHAPENETVENQPPFEWEPDADELADLASAQETQGLLHAALRVWELKNHASS